MRFDERRRWLACAGALAMAVPLVACGPPAAEPPREPPHGILLVVFDTLRADGLSIYGNPRATSPTLDGLARRGVLFEQAVSHAPWTLPGFIGLLSGSYPSGRIFAKGKLVVSLLDPLREAGYATAAFTEGGWTSPDFGFDRGIDFYWVLEGKTRLQRGDDAPIVPGGGGIERTFDAAIRWLRENRERRFFLMLQTYENHVPYRRREYAEGLPSGELGSTYEGRHLSAVERGAIQPSPQELAYVRALYDGGVRAADQQMARLLHALQELDLADQTVIAVTSDHGEALGERDPSVLGRHGDWLYDELLSIPLILYDPRIRYPVSRVSAQVRLVDVLPTLLDLASVETPSQTDGESLMPLVLGQDSADRVAFLQGHPIGPDELRRAGVRDGRYKLIANMAPRPEDVPALELYDLREDTQERHNLVDQSGAPRERMASLLRHYWSAVEGEEQGELEFDQVFSEELRERLESLGYLDD